MKASIQDKQDLVVSLSSKLDELKQRKKHLGELQNKESLAIKMRSIFKEMALRMAKHYTMEIAHKASGIFSEIMQDASYQLYWSEDYAITVYKFGEELSFEQLSGGQQIAASLAVRLGVLQELSHLRFAFFDEPTAHLDKERRNQLAVQLSAIKSFEQLFVITHDESFAGHAHHTINL